MGTPTIRGIFVNSHVSAVRKAKGAEGVRALEQRYGKPVTYTNTERVPIREEVKIIEIALQIMSDAPIPPEQVAFEAGRLHFRNFMTTPLGKFLLSFFKNDFKLVMMRVPSVADNVFEGVEFSAEDLGIKAVRITMGNNDYPLDHFKGVLYEWMLHSADGGTIQAEKTDGGVYQYTMNWE